MARVARMLQGAAFLSLVGMAACLWANVGRPRSTVIVKYFLDGSVNLNMGASDLGTGMRTIMAQVVAEELGVPIERIEVENADTGTTQFSDGANGSKTTMIDSPAVRAAALDVKYKLLDAAAEQLKVPAASLTLKNGEIIGPAGTPRTPVRNLPFLAMQ